MCRWLRDITYPVMEVTFFAAVKYFDANNANIGNFVLNAKNSIILICIFCNENIVSRDANSLVVYCYVSLYFPCFQILLVKIKNKTL